MHTKGMYRVAFALVLVAALVTMVACAGQSAPAPSSSKPADTSSAPAPKAAAPAPTAAAPSDATKPAPAAAAAKPASGDPYEINFITMLTGQMATSGQGQKKALDTYQSYANARGGINGRPVKFTYHDDQADAKISVQLVTDLVAKKVPVIMGPGMTGPTNAVVPLIAANGPVLYSMSPGVYPETGSYLFAAMPNNMQTFTGLLTFFKNKGWTKIAMLSSTDATGSDIAASVTKLLALPEFSTLSLVVDEKTEPTATSMAAQATKIKASNAQVVILGILGAPASTAFKGLAQAGVELPTGTAVGNQNYATMNANKDVLPKELYFPGSPSDVPEILPDGATKTVINDYRKLMLDGGNKPEVSHTVTWESASVIVEALKKTGTDVTPAKLRDTIQSIKGFEGLWGTYNFSPDNHRGVGPSNVYVERWDAAKDRWVAASGPGGALLKP